MKRLVFGGLVILSLIVAGIFIQTGPVRGETDYEKIISRFIDYRGVSHAEYLEAQEQFMNLGPEFIPALDSAFDEANVHGKFKILKVFRKMANEDSAQAVIDVLKRESERPPSGKRWFWIPEEVFIKKQCSYSLKIIGKVSLPLLRKNIPKAEGEFKKRLIITTGFLGSNEYYESIAKFARKDKDPFIRELATIALGDMGDKRAIPVLEKVLKDKFYCELAPPDRVPDTPAARAYNTQYPIRSAALNALKELGVKVKIRGLWDIQVIKE